ncbi:hypothetical protein [Saccharopolyspora phatthalungensis]|uniref:Uncharacterized protein n=1 Tax=Saccharopolyspora phatthalungensis TaxID=664693 RepID=A0A840QF31_9PSEU|nr:hypothetical protein [Saccharopolyspora phatthalungensis]MBB5158657.1 hypothetical protein [Saccharopolyspora phatthalungensis]
MAEDEISEAELAAAGAEPDVLLDVPNLSVEEIKVEVEDLRARVSLQAEVLDLVKLNVGADVALGRVSLTISGVQAEALLKVRLDTVARILERVLTTIDRNPQIIEQAVRSVEPALRGAGEAVSEVGRGAREAVEDLGGGVGEAVEEVGTGAAKSVESVGRGAGDAVGEVGRGAGEAAKEVGRGAGGAVGGVGEAARDVGHGAGRAVGGRKGEDESADRGGAGEERPRPSRVVEREERRRPADGKPRRKPPPRSDPSGNRGRSS